MVIDMGFLDGILGTNEKRETPIKDNGNPFITSLKFIPRRLSSMKEGSIDLEIKVTNNTADTQLVSIDAVLPKKILVGFDPTCLNKHTEKRLGNVEPGETKDVALRIWGSNQTKEGDYPIQISFYSHYLNYKKVLESTHKRTTVRVV